MYTVIEGESVFLIIKYWQSLNAIFFAVSVAESLIPELSLSPVLNMWTCLCACIMYICMYMYVLICIHALLSMSSFSISLYIYVLGKPRCSQFEYTCSVYSSQVFILFYSMHIHNFFLSTLFVCVCVSFLFSLDFAPNCAP